MTLGVEKNRVQQRSGRFDASGLLEHTRRPQRRNKSPLFPSLPFHPTLTHMSPAVYKEAEVFYFLVV